MTGLSPSDVVGLAESLAAGKNPKVVFTEAAGQVAGKTGKVVGLDEPREGDFVVVQFGHDELPFSTAEVRMPQRGEFSRKKASAVKVADEGPQGPPLLSKSDNEGERSTVRGKESGVVNDQPEVPQQKASEPAPSAAPAPRKRSTGKKQSPELSVTLMWREGAWSVQASKGAKVIAKPVPVKATAAVEMVQSLDSPAVAAVVEDIVEQQRQEAADEAERLRQELAAAEARLAELG